MKLSEIGFLVVAFCLDIEYLFVYCFLGKLASENYFKMSDCLYDFDWKRLPVNLQKYFILMIQNTQKPIYYHGFGVCILNLEMFTKVIT